MFLRLKGKVAIVTGGSRGIGRAICLRLAKEGCNVVVNYVRNQARANQVVKEIRAIGRQAFSVSADVSKLAQTEKLVKTTLEKFGRVDILVNNAGVYSEHLLTDLDEQEWDRVIQVNLKSTFNCCKSVVLHMINRNSGSIVSVSSIDGKQGFAGDTHY